MATTALSYMKNVAKSFGYAFADNFNEMNPTVSALFRETKSLTEELYETIADFKGKGANVDGSITSQIKDTTKDIWNNLNSDLRTGKWYNKARKDKAEMDAISQGFGIDFEDFGDFDFDDDETDLDEQASIQEDSARAMSKAMDVVGGKTANAICTATVNSANYIVQSSRMNTKALYALNVEGFGKLSQGIAAVNTNISTLIKLGEPLTKHMQNSSVFFARTNEFQDKAIKLLEQIAKNTGPKEKPKNKRATTIADIFTAEGLLDVGKIKEFVKAGGNGGGGMMSDVSMALSMLDMFGGPMGALKAFTGSPLSVVLPILTGQLFNVKGSKSGKSMRETMKEFNKALSGAFAGGVAKLQDTKFGDGILGSIGKLIQSFIPKSGVKNKPDPGAYEKGPVEWDGIARKALIDVIPTQLGKIISLLSGEQESVYDYKTGRWITASGVRQRQQERINSAVKTAGGELLYDLRRSIEFDSDFTQEEKRIANRQLTNYFQYLVFADDTQFMHLLDPKIKIQDLQGKIDPKLFANVQRRLRMIKKKYPGKFMQMASNFNAARSQYGRGIADADSVEMRLYNNSMPEVRGSYAFGHNGRTSDEELFKQWKRTHPKEARNMTFKDWKAQYGPTQGYYRDYTREEPDRAGVSILNQKDEFGKNQLFYLNGIYQFTGYLARNLKYLVPGKKPGKGKAITLEPAPLVQLSKATTDKLGSERIELIDDDKFDTTLDQDFTERLEDNDVSISFSKLYGKDNIIEKLPPEMRAYYYRVIENPSARDKEMDEKLAKAVKDVGKDSLQDKINNKFGKLASKSKFLTNMQKTLDVTADEMATIFGSVTETLNGMIYGKDEQGISLMDSVKTGVSNIFNELTLHIKDYIPEPIKKFFGSLWDSDFVKDIRSETKKTFKNMFGWFFDDKKAQEKEERERKRKEQAEAAREWQEANEWGGPGYNFGRGGYGSGLRRFRKIENNITYRNRKNQRYLGVGGGASAAAAVQPLPEGEADYAQGSDREYHTNAPGKKETGSDDSDPGGYESSSREIVSRVSHTLVGKFQDALTNLFGKNKPEEERKIIRKNIENLMGDVAGAKGAMGAGALTGAGVSLLTGAFVGPIAGAAIGASVGFITKSQTAQNILFGEQDEKGERKGGVFSKTVSNAIYDHLPSMSKGAAAGFAGGLLLGSPILGAIAGSTVGYVSSSEKAKEALFGKLDEEGNRKGGLISKEFQQQIKKAVPSMAKGAALMTLFGPAVPGGIVGKLLVGSALGFATSTDRFKTWFFGKDENGKYNKMFKGGFSELINKQLFMPIVDLFKNMTTMVTTTIKDVAHTISTKIRNFILSKLGAKLRYKVKNSFAGRALGKAGDKVARGALGLITAPGRALSSMARTSNIKHGRGATLNGRVMGVEDRVKYMEGKLLKGNPLYNNFDKELMDIKDNDEALLIQLQQHPYPS